MATAEVRGRNLKYLMHDQAQAMVEQLTTPTASNADRCLLRWDWNEDGFSSYPRESGELAPPPSSIFRPRLISASADSSS